MNGQIRGCPIQKTHVIVQPRNFDPIQKTHVKGGAAQLWGGPELIASQGAQPLQKRAVNPVLGL